MAGESEWLDGISNEDPIVLSADERAALGEVIAYAALIEELALGIVNRLNAELGEPGRGGKIGPRLQQIATHAHDAEAAAWATTARKAIEERDRLTHTAFIIRTTDPALLWGMRSHKALPITGIHPSALFQTRDACRAVWFAGRRINFRLSGWTTTYRPRGESCERCGRDAETSEMFANTPSAWPTGTLGATAPYAAPVHADDKSPADEHCERAPR